MPLPYTISAFISPNRKKHKAITPLLSTPIQLPHTNPMDGQPPSLSRTHPTFVPFGVCGGGGCWLVSHLANAGVFALPAPCMLLL